MSKKTQFFAFLESLKTASNKSLIESVKAGYSLMEGESTEDYAKFEKMQKYDDATILDIIKNVRATLKKYPNASESIRRQLDNATSIAKVRGLGEGYGAESGDRYFDSFAGFDDDIVDPEENQDDDFGIEPEIDDSELFIGHDDNMFIGTPNRELAEDEIPELYDGYEPSDEERAEYEEEQERKRGLRLQRQRQRRAKSSMDWQPEDEQPELYNERSENPNF